MWDQGNAVKQGATTMVVNSSQGCWLLPLFKIANLLSGSSHSLLHFLSLETKKLRTSQVKCSFRNCSLMLRLELLALNMLTLHFTMEPTKPHVWLLLQSQRWSVFPKEENKLSIDYGETLFLIFLVFLNITFANSLRLSHNAFRSY